MFDDRRRKIMSLPTLLAKIAKEGVGLPVTPVIIEDGGPIEASADDFDIDVNYGILMKRSTSETDANNIRLSGYYTTGTNFSNLPNTSKYGLLIVFNNVSKGTPLDYDYSWLYQFYISTNLDALYMRGMINKSDWSDWKKVTFS